MPILFVSHRRLRYRSEAILADDTVPPAQDEVELLKPLELNALPSSRVLHLWIEQ